MSNSNKFDVYRLGVEEASIQKFVDVDIFFIPFFIIRLIQHNDFNYLLDYGNEHVDKNSNEEEITRNYLSLTDSFIDEKIQEKQQFKLSNEGKMLRYFKNIRRRDKTTISDISLMIIYKLMD